MFDWIKGLLKSIWDFIKEYWIWILIVIIIIICIFFPYLIPMILMVLETIWGWIVVGAAAVAEFFAALGLEGALAAALGISFLMDPEGTAAAIGTIIESVGDAAGSVVGSGLGALASSPVGLLAGVGLLLYFMSGSSDDDPPDKVSGNDRNAGFAETFNSSNESAAITQNPTQSE